MRRDLVAFLVVFVLATVSCQAVATWLLAPIGEVGSVTRGALVVQGVEIAATMFGGPLLKTCAGIAASAIVGVLTFRSRKPLV